MSFQAWPKNTTSLESPPQWSNFSLITPPASTLLSLRPLAIKVPRITMCLINISNIQSLTLKHSHTSEILLLGVWRSCVSSEKGKTKCSWGFGKQQINATEDSQPSHSLLLWNLVFVNYIYSTNQPINYYSSIKFQKKLLRIILSDHEPWKSN